MKHTGDEKPQTLAPDFERIPPELRGIPRWIVWRWVRRNGAWTKPPYCARTGELADVTQPENWSTFEEVAAAYKSGKYSGVGFVLDGGFAGIDLDGCRDPDSSEIEPWALDIIQRIGSYTEVSPSGTGVKTICRITDAARLSSVEPPKGVEFYVGKRYFTLTGHTLPGYETVQERQAALEELFPARQTAGGAVKLDTTGEGGDDAPLIVRAVEPFLPKRARDILAGRVQTNDRSGLSFELARLCVETGLRDAEAIAQVVMASPYHQEKFGGRQGGYDALTDALKVAERALDAEQDAAAAETPGLPPFPEHAVRGICGDIAQMFAARLEAPYAFWAVSALTCLGAAISGSVTLDTALAPDPRLYTVTVGQTASARKSTAIGFVAEFFAEALRPLGTLHIEHGLGSAEGLAEVLQRDDDKPARCLLLIDELKMLVQKARIEHSALLPMLCTMFSRRNFANATRRSKIRLENAHISILSACTADTFASMWTPEFLDIGFLNRLLIVPGDAERSVALPEEIPPEEWNKLAARLARLVEEVHRQQEARLVIGNAEFPIQLGAPRRLKLSEEAHREWEDWYANRPRSVHARRLEEIGLRLMILLEVSRGNLSTVEADTVEGVLRLLEWELAVRRAYDPLDAENKIALLEQRIKRALYAAGGSLTEGVLRKRVHAERFGEKMFAWALENLEEAGVVIITRKGKKRVSVALTVEAREELERDA